MTSQGRHLLLSEREWRPAPFTFHLRKRKRREIQISLRGKAGYTLALAAPTIRRGSLALKVAVRKLRTWLARGPRKLVNQW